MARIWRSYPGRPDLAQIPDVSGWRNAIVKCVRRPLQEVRVVKFRPQCAVAGKAKHVSGSKSRSQQLYDRALKSLPGGNSRTTVFMQPYPIYAARGEGCRVFDIDGNEYIDCINNFTSLIHGHAHPVLVEASTRQLVLGSAFGVRRSSILNRGVLAAGYGLMTLSTPMTDVDIDTVITAASDAPQEVSASA